MGWAGLAGMCRRRLNNLDRATPCSLNNPLQSCSILCDVFNMMDSTDRSRTAYILKYTIVRAAMQWCTQNILLCLDKRQRKHNVFELFSCVKSTCATELKVCGEFEYLEKCEQPSQVQVATADFGGIEPGFELLLVNDQGAHSSS